MKICILVLVLLVLTSKPYTIQYRDCMKPTFIKYYDVNEMCKSETGAMNEYKKYTILQKKRKSKLCGYKCQIIKSSWLMYCGVFSYEKMVKIPEIEIKQTRNIAQCNKLISTRSFKTSEQTWHQLELNTENVFSVKEKGITHGQTECLV